MNVRNIILLLLSAAFMACGDNKPSGQDGGNGVYYWRTTFETDSTERAFMRENDIRRAYVRFFDVVVDKSPLAMDVVVPNATLQIKDSIPAEEIVPVVYITVDAIKAIQSDEAKWAEKIVRRVWNMCSYNELGSPKELQLDCDWTSQTGSAFFKLCKAVKQELSLRDAAAKLSATIRLHQLAQTPPPVDRGVLMVYNTGSFRNPEETNSILTVESVRPYLKHLADYPLPLDYAFPIFSWKLLYTENTFRGIISPEVNIPDDVLSPSGENRFTVVKDTVIGSTCLLTDDMIRAEDVSFRTIKEVKSLIEKASDGAPRSIILYSLDTRNISNYTEDEFKEIYK